ncbi:MAG: DUF4340 domain-containing protein [Gammaproteobacteria bacterium]|nr:DUF4340 domain-containing protein [Gammaproteobacteria bacterium]
MKHKKLLILSFITVAVILAAGITAKLRAPQITKSKDDLFPELAAHINNVSKIDIRGNQRSVLLRQKRNIWVIENADNYPALFNKVRETVINMSELRILDEKTDNPDLYSRLGVEGPEAEGTTSLLFTFRNDTDQEIAALIVGSQRQSSSSKPGLYVRKLNNPKALLVEGTLNITDHKEDWFERNLFDISSARVREVQIKQPDDNNLIIYKENKGQTDFELQNITEEKKNISRIILNRIGTSLEEMRADDVRSLDQFMFPDDTIVTTISTFDGLKATVKSAKIDGKTYAHFEFSFDPALAAAQQETSEPLAEEKPATDKVSAEQEARILKDSMSNWVYQIPDFKYEALTMNIDNITKPFPPESGNDALDAAIKGMGIPEIGQ